MIPGIPLSLIVLLLGAICFFICSSIAGTRVWPVLFYWTGWTAGIYAAETLSGDGVMPVFTLPRSAAEKSGRLLSVTHMLAT